MKASFLAVGIFALFTVRLPAAETQQPAKEQALNAIHVFRLEPQSPAGRAAGQFIVQYAEKNPNVTINVNAKLVPFRVNLALSEQVRSILFAAFIVGNLESQLLRNEKKDDPYAGELEVIETYRQMQKKDPTLRIDEIQNFIDLEKRGQLKSYVASP